MIDRKALVSRHNPVAERHDPYSPLSIGNGEIAFTADVSGFQSFPVEPESAVPLCTMAQWGFHCYPGMKDREAHYARLKLKSFDTGVRRVGYMSEPAGQERLFTDLRINPHRANLFRLSLAEPEAGGVNLSALELNYCDGIHQELDLWEGLLSSWLTYRGVKIDSEACCHPSRDILSYRVQSDLLAEGRLSVNLDFPYPSHNKDGSDWNNIQGHSSRLEFVEESEVYIIERLIDDLKFSLILHIAGSGTLKQTDLHSFMIIPDGAVLSFSLELKHPGAEVAEDGGLPPVSMEECLSAASAYWNGFWNTGAAVELKDSSDPRALELERRIILSRYLTAIQCSGTFPPQETGLTCNCWYGKFHLEMHPWHAAFFPLWGKPEMLENSLGYYRDISARAMDRASGQGYAGLRWPKMTDPEGFDSPSEIGPFLCWQQPHFIFMAELLFLTGGGETILKKYADLVLESAEFIADYPVYNSDTDSYDLGPPLIPAQENHLPEETRNPVFELEYWKLGLDIAALWQIRLGRKVPVKWKRVRRRLAKPPVDPDLKAYAAHQNCSDTYGDYAADHPSFLTAFSFFSGSDIDPEIMSRSLDLVLKRWDRDSLWGWDFPMMAMCAARLGRLDDAMDILLMSADKNTYLANGHNTQLPKEDLPLYLPGNGALLLAVAMIAGSLQGSEDDMSFSGSESWVFRNEGFSPYPF